MSIQTEMAKQRVRDEANRDYVSPAENDIKIGQCRSFTIEKAPKFSGMKAGQRHAGYVKAIRNNGFEVRVTIEDECGYCYTVRKSRVGD